MTDSSGSARSSGRLSPSRIRSTPASLQARPAPTGAAASVIRPVIARVQPLTTTRRLAGPFDYALPDAPVDVGSVVRVPFGHQALDGVVVGLAPTTEVPAEKLVTPTAVREDSVPPELVALALWMAEEYCSTPARALSLVLPPQGQAAHGAVGRAHGRAARRRAADRATSGRCSRRSRARRAGTSARCAGSRRAGWWRSRRAAGGGRR